MHGFNFSEVPEKYVNECRISWSSLIKCKIDSYFKKDKEKKEEKEEEKLEGGVQRQYNLNRSLLMLFTIKKSVWWRGWENVVINNHKLYSGCQVIDTTLP